jgi:hypothetical protein
MSMSRLTITLLAACAALPAAAHHSAAMFDLGKEIELVGVVTKYAWRNPHTYIALRIRHADGTAVEQQIEAGPSSTMQPLGLRADSVRVGEVVTVRANPLKEGVSGHIVLGRELIKADGTVLPLHLGPETAHASPTAAASSLAGTWYQQGFFSFYLSANQWPVNDRARAAIGNYDFKQTTQKDCIPFPPPMLMLYPVATMIEVARDIVKLHVDWMSSERVIYLDGRPHPAGGERTLLGHSVGHWEGDTLVVDTAQFADHKEGNVLVPSGARKHLTERFSLGTDHRHLEYEFTLEDPDVFVAPLRFKAEWDYRPDLKPTRIACDPAVGRRFLTGE